MGSIEKLPVLIHGKTISCAESCTGGLLSALITSVSGASSFFPGSVVSYSNEVKIKVLGVNSKTIETYGAVSKETSIEMATGCKNLFSTDFAVSITGIAGPLGGTVEKPVGTVHICIIFQSKRWHGKFMFDGNREEIRKKSVIKVIDSITLLLEGIFPYDFNIV